MKSTQKAKILAWLKSRKELTTVEAVTELHILSPTRRITELRRDGHNIDMTYRTSVNGARYGVYTLNE